MSTTGDKGHKSDDNGSGEGGDDNPKEEKSNGNNGDRYPIVMWLIQLQTTRQKMKENGKLSNSQVDCLTWLHLADA